MTPEPPSGPGNPEQPQPPEPAPLAQPSSAGGTFDIQLHNHAQLGAAGANATVHMYGAPRRELVWPVIPVPAPSRASAYQNREIATTVPAAGSVVLSGSSGFGKTQIAAGIFAESTADLRLWVPASTTESVLASYADAATALDLTDSTEPIERRARAFLGWAAGTNRSWLIVLDNIDQPAQLNPSAEFPGGLWPPIRPAGLTLATTTSRHPELGGGGRVQVHIDPYTPTEANAYLNERLTPAINTAELPADALDQAAELAHDLGYHPLALGQAAALILLDAYTTTRYRTLLAQRRLDQAMPDQARADGYSGTLHATWTLAHDRAQAQTDGLALPLLLYLAVLDPTGAPDTLLTTTALTSYLSEDDEVDATEVRAAVRVLHRLSLTTHVPGQAPRQLRTHPVTARITREHATPDQHTAALRAAADSLMEVWPDIEIDITLAGDLRSNATTIIEHDTHDTLWDQHLYPGGHPLLFRHGQSLGQAGLLHPAISYHLQLVEQASQILGPDHPHTLTARGNLAHWRGEAGDPVNAARESEVLLGDRLRVLGPDHPDTLSSRNNVAGWRGQAGDPAGAVADLGDLVDDLARVLGPDHPGTFNARNNLLGWRAADGDVAGALAAAEELLDEELLILGADHPQTLATRHNLAGWGGQTGDPVGAASALEAVLDDQLQILGPDHPQTLKTRSNLAYWRGQASGPIGAAAANQELLADRLRVLGPDHPDTLATRHNLAYSRGETGDLVGAATEFEELLADRLRVLGADHPDTLNTRHNLLYWCGQADHPAADIAAAYEVLLYDQLRALGSEHANTAAFRNYLTHWRARAGLNR